MFDIYLETERLTMRTKKTSELPNEHLMDTDKAVRCYTGGIVDFETTEMFLHWNIEKSLESGYGYYTLPT